MQHLSPLEAHLTKFREAFHLTKCLQERNHIIYIFPGSRDASREAAEANFLIHKLDLPLSAIHCGNCSFFTVVGQEAAEL